jgi:hypothetical protein
MSDENYAYNPYENAPKSKLAQVIERLAPIVFIAIAIILGWTLLTSLGGAQLPVPRASGITPLSIATARNMAIHQLELGHYSEAATHFQNYFAWGGTDQAAMELYAQALRKTGHAADADEWDRKSKAKSFAE